MEGGKPIIKNYQRTITITITIAFLFLLGMTGFIQSAMAVDVPAVIAEVKKESKPEVKPQKNPYADAKITTRIIPAANKTFGYDILLYGKPLVHQPNIPGLPGNEGFTTKAKAQKVADFVAKKIRNNEMPPTVTMEDLNKMSVLK